jgi:hypothetical protein
MKRALNAILVTAVVLSGAKLSLAQDRPGGPPPPQDRGGGGERREMRPDDRRPGPDGGLPGPGAMRAGREMQMQHFELMRGYIDLVERFTRMARDPAAAGVAAVVAVDDMMKKRGPDAAIEYFNKVLPDVKNESVQRAIRIQLVHLYQQSGQSDKAVEQLDALIKGAPAGAGATGEGPNR